MGFLRQEGSKKNFVDSAYLLQPNAPWAVTVEPFAGSAAVGLGFAKLYPDRRTILAERDYLIVNGMQQVQSNLAESQEWSWRYSRCLETEKGAEWLWTRFTDARDNPQAFCPPQLAALRFHAGPIGALTALNSHGRRSGFSPARAGYRNSRRWVGSHGFAIEELAQWSALLQRVEINHADYRETVNAVIEAGEKAFFFMDSPYRFGRQGKLSAGDVYYGAPFDVDELGRQCQRINDAGHFAMVTLDWCAENQAMFGADWTVMRASWKSYDGVQSEHLIAFNYSPLIPADEVATIKGWEITQRQVR